MKHYNIQDWLTVFLLPLTLLWGCNVEEIDRGNNPLPEGVTRLSVSLSSGVRTRAVGDKLTDATDNEKRIDRLAFIVHTEMDGMQVYPPLKTGEQAKDFPNKVELKDNGDGTYSAVVDLTAGGGYDADIVALANLPEDYDYSQIVTWAGLLDSVTVSTQTMPVVTDAAGGKAFIMQGNTTVALHKEKEEKFNLPMERLVARIDITNMAYTSDDKGFKLTSARILRAMPASYLYPHDLYASPDTQTVTHESWSFKADAVKYYMGEVEDANEKTTEVTGGDPAAADREAVWHNLYTYENSDTQHAPTALEITGTFRGLSVTRQIPFEVIQPDGITKKPVSLVRNHRYLVLIKPAQGLTDIGYEIKVDEWNAVDTIHVQPNQDQIPSITGYTCAEATKQFGITPDNPMPDSIVIPATGGTIKFTASCPFDSRVTFGYASAEDKGTGDGWLSVTRTDAVVTKAEPTLTREYTVTVAADNALDATLTNRGYLYIANGGNGSIVDTITVFQGADIAYGDLRLAAITAYDIVWAPVNCGGTTDLTTIGTLDSSAPWDVAIHGYYYQWGRSVPFSYVRTDLAPAGTCPTYAEGIAEGYQYADKFIKGTGGSGYSWFSDSKSPTLSPLLQVGDKGWPRAQQPCPAGWRVPSDTELRKIVDDVKKSGIVGGKWVCPSNNRFVLPAGGYRNSGDGLPISVNSACNYWSSTLDASGYSYCLFAAWSNFGVDSDNIAYGMPVRCVQE